MNTMILTEPSAGMKSYLKVFRQHVLDRFQLGNVAEEIQIGIGEKGEMGNTTIALGDLVDVNGFLNMLVWDASIEFIMHGIAPDFVAVAVPCTGIENGNQFIAIKAAELTSAVVQQIPYMDLYGLPFPGKVAALDFETPVDSLFVALRRGVTHQG